MDQDRVKEGVQGLGVDIRLYGFLLILFRLHLGLSLLELFLLLSLFRTSLFVNIYEHLERRYYACFAIIVYPVLGI